MIIYLILRSVGCNLIKKFICHVVQGKGNVDDSAFTSKAMVAFSCLVSLKLKVK